jgi:L-iditol 2-dehydrogenase
MRGARDGGRVVVVGQYTDAGDTAFNPHADLNRRHLEVRGCWGSDHSHFDRAVRLMANPARAARFTEIPSRRYPLGRAVEALADVAARRVVKAIIDPRA